MKSEPLILAIDTSCDETSLSISLGLKILSNVISSQVELHKKYGGVVPLIAKRAHQENINLALKEAFKRASKQLNKAVYENDIDVIAVTKGPGLAIALEVGIEKAKEIATKYNKRIIEINHMEGHLLSCLAQNTNGKSNIKVEQLKFPVLGLLVSGGHTELILVKEIGKYELVGQTLDDAMGEGYDKVARMLGIGYPGGKTLSEFADKGEDKYNFSIPMLKDDSLNYSYSGIKTAVMYQIRLMKGENPRDGKRANTTEFSEGLDKQEIYDLAKSFEVKAIAHLSDKLDKAIKRYTLKQVLCGGGVMANTKVRNAIRKTCKNNKANAYFPISNNLYTDNAAMIAIAAYFKYQKNQFIEIYNLDRDPELEIE